MKGLSKSETYGLVGTIVAAILLLLVLLFCTMSFVLLKDESSSGLDANFGESLEGQGLYEPAPASVLESVPAPTPTPVSSPSTPAVTEQIQTQSIEESLAIKEAKEKEKERKKQEQEQQRLEKERLQQEQHRIDEQKRIEAQKAQKLAAIKSKTMGAFSGSGTVASLGEGSGNSSGNQGNPFGTNGKGNSSGFRAGNGSGVGTSYMLGKRGIVGSIPRPTDNTQVEGVIVIDISVDTGGTVLTATIGQGTTITEASARNAALSAARKAKFSKGERIEIGTITFRFMLN